MPTIEQSIKNLEALRAKVPKIVANEMVNYALDNIRKGVDVRGKPFKPRKPGSQRNIGRGPLVDTGEGRRSIEARADATGATLTANKYMQAHNDGVNKTVSVRSFTRTRKGRSESVRGFSRQMNLPQRQFTGKSDAQTERIEKIIQQLILKAVT
jgi:phage gpG-like protein